MLKSDQKDFLEKNDYFKIEAIKKLREKIQCLRNELSVVENEMGSEDEEKSFLAIIAACSIFSCLGNLKEKAIEISKKSLKKK